MTQCAKLGLISSFILTAWVFGASDVEGQAVAFERVEVASGVHVFRSSEPGAGNVVAIVSGETALVIDAAATPTHARSIAAELAELGVRQLRGVVLTHWHPDHVFGTQAFLEPFPSAPVISQAETLAGIRDIATPDLAVQIERIQRLLAERDSLLRADVNAAGEPMSDSERETLAARQSVFRELGEGLSEVRPVLPNLTFDEAVRLQVGDLEVRLAFLGPAHSSGDIVAFIPARGVLVAGDLLTTPFPAAADGFSSIRGWQTALEELITVDAQILIPGHGAPMRDPGYLDDVRDLFRSLIGQVRDGIRQGLEPDVIRENLDLSTFIESYLAKDERSLAGFDAFFVRPATAIAHRELARSGR